MRHPRRHRQDCHQAASVGGAARVLLALTRGGEKAQQRRRADHAREVLPEPGAHLVSRAPQTPTEKPHLYGHFVYNPKALWDWVRTHNTEPSSRQRFWREDWWDLHDRYDIHGPVPEFVARLPSLAHNQWVWEDNDFRKPKVRVEWPNGYAQYFEGAKNQECLVRAEGPKGQKWYYEGPYSDPILKRAEFPDGTVKYTTTVPRAMSTWCAQLVPEAGWAVRGPSRRGGARPSRRASGSATRRGWFVDAYGA